MTDNDEKEVQPRATEQPTPAQREVMRLQQEMHAMQCILDGLVATHPQPEELLKICRDVQTLLAGPLTEKPTTEPANLSGLTGWRTVMRRYIGILEQGSRLRKPSPAS